MQVTVPNIPSPFLAQRLKVRNATQLGEKCFKIYHWIQVKVPICFKIHLDDIFNTSNCAEHPHSDPKPPYQHKQLSLDCVFWWCRCAEN